MKSCAVFLKCFFFLFFGFQLMHIDDPLTFGPTPSSAHTFGLMISSPSSQCSQCTGYSSRISDLETRLTVAKRQAQMAFCNDPGFCQILRELFFLPFIA
jgi:hypothetical protein